MAVQVLPFRGFALSWFRDLLPVATRDGETRSNQVFNRENATARKGHGGASSSLSWFRDLLPAAARDGETRSNQVFNRENATARKNTRRPMVFSFAISRSMLAPHVLEDVLRPWVQQLLARAAPPSPNALQAVAMDGKSLCGTLGVHGRTLHLLSKN
jgi:hypothetical protein